MSSSIIIKYRRRDGFQKMMVHGGSNHQCTDQPIVSVTELHGWRRSQAMTHVVEQAIHQRDGRMSVHPKADL